MKYRPEVDGLRAVAVVPVVLFHAKLGPLQGGFIGVDIFFVISGYLITSLLTADLEKGEFSILRFYDRRARRILPALFLVMLACLPFAYAWMFPLELNDFAQSLVATTLFGSNFLFWSESGYFSPNAELKPLLHTWSLAIEEQYYILFPLCLFLLWRGQNRKRRTALVLGLAALASFALCAFGTRTWPDANFYLLPARAWELLVGALCAILIERTSPHGGASLLGALLILAGLIFCDDELWPSAMTLLPVAGTALIILFASPAGLVGRVLSLPPVVGIGLISYSAYLWHQPLLAFARLRAVEEPSRGVLMGLAVMSFVLAYLSWRFVEQPFRARGTSGPRISQRAVFGSAVCAGAAMIAIGLLGDATNGFRDRKAPSGLAFTEIEERIALSRADWLPCDTDISFRAIPEEPPADCVFPAGNGEGRHAIVIGDSHATVMSRELRDLLTEAGYEVTLNIFGGCTPFPGYALVGRDCDTANEAAYRHIEQRGYDLILIAARPQLLIAGERQIFFRDENTRALADKDRVLAMIRDGMARLIATGAEVVLIEPIPEMPVDIGQFVKKSYAFRTNEREIRFEIPVSDYALRTDGLSGVLDALPDKNLTRVHSSEVFCPDGGCIGVEAGQPLYFDDNHLSIFGIEKLIPAIREAIDRTKRS